MHDSHGLVPRPGFPIAPILTGQLLEHPTRFPKQIRRGTIHVLHEYIDQAKIPAPGLSSSRRCVFEAQYPRMQSAPVALDRFRAARVNRLFQPCADTAHILVRLLHFRDVPPERHARGRSRTSLAIVFARAGKLH
jgi:hypothetical protein